MFVLLYKHADDGVFDDFPKTSNHYPRISEDFPKLSRRPDERFRTFSENSKNFWRCPKISKDCPKTFEEHPRMFQWFTNEFKYNLRDKLYMWGYINACEDILSFLWFVTTRYTTDFNMIKDETQLNVFSLLLKCSTASEVLYNRTEHSRGFFLCFMIKNPIISPSIRPNFQTKLYFTEK